MAITLEIVAFGCKALLGAFLRLTVVVKACVHLHLGLHQRLQAPAQKIPNDVSIYEASA